MDKKIGLEHTIRNIINESLGAGVTTDKFKGSQKAFLQPAPQIKPKVGDAHPDGSAVTAKRGLAKINQSETMKEEEQIDETAAKLLVKGGELLAKTLGYADDAADAKKMTKDFWSKIKPAEELPVVKPTEKLPAGKSTTTSNVPATTTKAPSGKTAGTPPATAPSQTPPAVTPGTPQTPPAVKTPTTTPAPAPVTVPKTGTSVGTKLGVAGATATAVGTAIATKLKTKTKGKGDGTTPPPGKPPKPGREGGMIAPPLGLPGAPDISGSGSGRTIDVPTYTHRAGKRSSDRFSEEYNLQDAEEIKRKSRKAQIIRKIIDEQKKKKRDTATVDLHPKLKNQEPDQN